MLQRCAKGPHDVQTAARAAEMSASNLGLKLIVPKK